MKRVNNLYSNLCNLDNIIKMTDKVCLKVKNKNKVNNFELFKMEHIINIKNRLESKNIKLNNYNIFLISDPKCRVVMNQSIEDKIINHLIGYYVLSFVFENKFTNSMIATRIEKGTDYGVKLTKKYLNELKRKNKIFYILKIDIKKYFYNIDHDILKNILKKKIKDKDALVLLNNVIDSTNDSYLNYKINKLKTERIRYLEKNIASKKDRIKLINEVNEIPLYKHNKGCPIGLQTSQTFGLIYLYEINHFIKEKLHIKYVINYMDDILIFHEDKEYLKYCLNILKDKLYNEYKLEINTKKTSISSIRNGVDFLGYRFYIKNNKIIIKLRNTTKKKFKRNVKNLNILKDYNYINKKEFNMLLSSYKGHLKYGNCKNLYYSVVRRQSYMINLFRQLKLDYNEYVLIFKSGSFYICFDEDATILNNLFNYKIVELKDNLKSGFPLTLLDNNRKILEEKNINHLIIDNKKIIDIYESKHNNFNKFKKSVFNIISYNKRINDICNLLKDIEDYEKLNDILDKIENIIKKR